jgi:hypothetical protein
MASTKNWRKQVTVNPAAGLTFSMDPLESKPQAFLTLKNYSDKTILYKVRTTNPDYYVVRPNQGILKPQQDTTTKVIFNFPLDSKVSDIWLFKPLTHSHLREYLDRKRNNR